MTTNISGNKILFNLDSIVNRTPITADIFLNDYCNNKCPYCTYARYGERNGEYMPFEDFVKYTDILLGMGAKGIILTGGGEPTISRDFDQVTAYLEEKGIPYGINTNFNRLKLIKPTYLKVSLDAWDEDSYQKKRGVRAYEKTIKNIRAYLEWRNANNVGTTVGIQLVVTDIDEIRNFYAAHKDLGVDYMNFRPMESTDGIYYEQHDEAEIVAYLEELKKKDKRVVINYKWYSLRKKFARCYAHFTQIAINQRGEVMYCCHKPYELNGHITDKDIKEKIENAVTNMRMCDVPCRLTAPNEFVSTIEAGTVNSEFI